MVAGGQVTGCPSMIGYRLVRSNEVGKQLPVTVIQWYDGMLLKYSITTNNLNYFELSMITPIHITYSPTYPSVETGDMHRY